MRTDNGEHQAIQGSPQRTGARSSSSSRIWISEWGGGKRQGIRGGTRTCGLAQGKLRLGGANEPEEDEGEDKGHAQTPAM